MISQIDRELAAPGTSELPKYLSASDLHGSAERVRQMIRTADEEGIEQLIFAGDLYDGENGWQLYETIRPLVDQGRIVPLWGNHELAFVHGMLGSKHSMRFFLNFGGRKLIRDMNA